MSYDNNIPVSGQTLGGTRAQINQNFADIDTDFQINHVAFNDSGAGKHKFMQMPVQASVPTTASSEGGLYVEDDLSGVAQLNFRGETNGSSYQLTLATNGVDPNIATIGAANGWSFIPGGLLIQWGSGSAPSGTSGTFSFPRAFSVTPYSLQVSIVRSSGASANYGFAISTVNSTGFKTNSGYSSSHTFYWIAIGTP